MDGVVLGLNEILCCSVDSHLSANWFPAEERATATGIFVMANSAGTSAVPCYFILTSLTRGLRSVTMCRHCLRLCDLTIARQLSGAAS